VTSVASYGNATTAGNYTLVFSGTRLGDWVETFKSGVSRPTEIAVRQNLWSTTVLLDGSYPAFSWDHEFVVYTESGSLRGYLDRYFSFARQFFSRTRPLELRAGDTTSVVVDFGNCYMKPFTQENPGDLLLQRAGMIRLQFIGTAVPTVRE
jgi:hypothetical protein